MNVAQLSLTGCWKVDHSLPATWCRQTREKRASSMQASSDEQLCVAPAANANEETISANDNMHAQTKQAKPQPSDAAMDRHKFQELQANGGAIGAAASSYDIDAQSGAIAGDKAHTKSGSDMVGEELIRWLETNGAETKKLALQEYAPEVRGVHSRKVLMPGERILTIPRKCLITVEMGKMTPIGQKLLAHKIDFVAPKHIFLMMFLLTDMENVRLWIILAQRQVLGTNAAVSTCRSKPRFSRITIARCRPRCAICRSSGPRRSCSGSRARTSCSRSRSARPPSARTMTSSAE